MISDPECSFCIRLAGISGVHPAKYALDALEAFCKVHCPLCRWELGSHSIQHPHARKLNGIMVCGGITAKEVTNA